MEELPASLAFEQLHVVTAPLGESRDTAFSAISPAT
jgi:hypothetical protein